MAIAIGTSSDAGRIFNNGRTLAHITDVADYRLLLAWIWTGAPNQAVTACTYNGVAMTNLINVLNVGGQDIRCNLYYMIAPPEGNHDVIYILTGNCMNACSAQAWAGVDPEDAFGVPITNTGNTNLITATVGSAANEVVVDGGGFESGAARVITLGAGQTLLASANSGPGASIGYGSSYEIGAAANVMTWGIAAVQQWATGAVALRPFIPFATRPIEYEFNVWDPLQRLIGRDGHEVRPNEVRADKWGKLLGFRSPSSKTYATLAEGPDNFYISGVTSDGEMVRITPDEKLFADMILKRITR